MGRRLKIAEGELQVVHSRLFAGRRRLLVDDVPVLHLDLPLAAPGEIRRVRDHDQGHSARALQIEQKVQNCRCIGAVEIAGWLIGENERRIVDDAARDGDSLTLPAGQLLGQVRGAVGETDRLERFLNPAPPLARAGARAEHRHLDVLAGGQGGKQIELLKHDADFGAPQIGPLSQCRDGLALPAKHAGRGDPDAAHHEDERCLAAPARADNGHRLAFPEGKVDVLQRNNAPIVEAMADMVERDERLARPNRTDASCSPHACA